MFFHAGRRVPREELGGALSPTLSSPLSAKQKLIWNQSLRKVHIFRGQGRGRQAGRQARAECKTAGPVDGPRIWLTRVGDRPAPGLAAGRRVVQGPHQRQD